jgi:solute carrier family 35
VYSNVETFITFRSATPLVLSVCDWAFLGRELPGGRSLAAIFALVASCAGYTYFDQGFHIQAYTWLCVWVAFFLFEACYVKHVCDTVSMTNWGRVYYTNFLAAIALLVVFPFCAAEHEVLRAAEFGPGQVTVLLLSCAVGVCMSHAGYLMRSNVSATAGVVVGVVCKIGSVLLNLLVRDARCTAHACSTTNNCCTQPMPHALEHWAESGMCVPHHLHAFNAPHHRRSGISTQIRHSSASWRLA